MRVAILSDTHGNLVALEAALADLGGQSVDSIVCLGDVAATGPQPRETLRRVRALGCPMVMGNCDQHLLDVRADPPPSSEPPDLIGAVDSWCATELSDEDEAFIRSFQPTVSIELAPGRALLCYHGSPRSFNDLVQPFTPDDELAGFFAGHEVAIGAGGHTHNQMLRRFGAMLLLNPGSIGLPLDRFPPDDKVRNPAWAEYALVTSEGAHLGIELCRVPYELAALERAVRASGMPHADEYLADWTAA